MRGNGTSPALGCWEPVLTQAQHCGPHMASALPDLLEVLSDIDEMSRRRPEVLGCFSVSAQAVECGRSQLLAFSQQCWAPASAWRTPGG